MAADPSTNDEAGRRRPREERRRSPPDLVQPRPAKLISMEVSMSVVPRVALRCPYCSKSSDRSVAFVRARQTFVCNHCREVAWINPREAALALERLILAGETRVEVLGGPLGL